MSSDVEAWEDAEPQLKAAVRSSIRSKILLYLLNGEAGNAELSKRMDVRETSTAHALKELIDDDMIVRTSKGLYHLTPLGYLQALVLKNTILSLSVLVQKKEFWLNHDIRGIPAELLQKISMLSESKIIMADEIDLLKPHENFLQEISKATIFQGVSPIIAPGHVDLVIALVKAGKPAQLILTENVLRKILAVDPRPLELLKYDNFELYTIRDDVKVAFTVTDKILSLGLFELDGSYDLTKDMICVGESAVRWGRELFDYYHSRAVLFTEKAL